MRVVERVREGFPQLKVYARARSRHHAHLLMRAGVHTVIRELLFSSLELTRNVLCALDVPKRQADRIIASFRAHDEQTLKRQMDHFGDETRLIQSVREASDELRSLFESDTEITTPSDPERPRRP